MSGKDSEQTIEVMHFAIGSAVAHWAAAGFVFSTGLASWLKPITITAQSFFLSSCWLA
jgi:hypothetical protein